mmetsp:Transcript_11632/g.23633  ORF Transcript_11632/g.23633 Transcript_11632/m.23633 type:complete len:205 (-) Transcript_11632:2420-3034(-)
MCQNPHHTRHAVRGCNVEKLKRLHLETKRRVDDQQHEVCDLGRINHRRQVGAHLQEGEPSLPSRHQGYRPCNVANPALRVMFHQRPDDATLAHPFRPRYRHNPRCILAAGAVHPMQRHPRPLFLLLRRYLDLLHQSTRLRQRLLVPTIASRSFAAVVRLILPRYVLPLCLFPFLHRRYSMCSIFLNRSPIHAINVVADNATLPV